ncbi:MAG: GNAT family N-acetyltransferase [Pseudomonadota bacterium]
MIEEIPRPEARRAICMAMLDGLPEWFGPEPVYRPYCDAAETMSGYAWRADGRTLGYLALSRETDEAMEIHLLAISRDAHGRGIGRAFISFARDQARAAGAAYLTLKTLGPSSPDEAYIRTRAFYRAQGFAALAEFPAFWAPDQPMLLMAAPL